MEIVTPAPETPVDERFPGTKTTAADAPVIAGAEPLYFQSVCVAVGADVGVGAAADGPVLLDVPPPPPQAERVSASKATEKRVRFGFGIFATRKCGFWSDIGIPARHYEQATPKHAFK